MSSESDSEVFFDAEDITPVRTAENKAKTIVETNENAENSAPYSDEVLCCESTSHFSTIQVHEDDMKEAERKIKEDEKRRKKVEELRNRMLKDDDETLDVPSEQSSLASSVEGIYPTGNATLPRVLPKSTEESRSAISLGNIGCFLSEKSGITSDTKESDTISSDSKYSVSGVGTYYDWNVTSFPHLKSSEPDLVASTKGDRPETLVRPVAPPRKKRRPKNPPAIVTPTDGSETSSVAELPSPTDPVENLARELEYSLDLHSAIQGQYVVKPQDREQDRAEGPTNDVFDDNNIMNAQNDDKPNRSPSSTTSKSNSLRKESSEDSPQPYMVRTRTDSGRPLTDQEILAQVKVLNLDTGEQIPLNLAEEHLPKCLNPLSLHIMRLTSEYISNTALDKERESDEESIDSRKAEGLDAHRVWSKTKGIGKLIGRNIENRVHRLRTVVADKVHHNRHNEEDISEDEAPADTRSNIEIKVSSKLKSVDKGKSEFEKIRVVQELSGEHTGAVWTMKFSSCGRLLATAGQDHNLRIWVLRDSFKYFDDMRQKYNDGKSSPTPSQESCGPFSSEGSKMEGSSDENLRGPFMEKPFCRYTGHTAELLDVSWSKSYFILSSSMDKTVRLWHIACQECLCCFQHIDFVTAIAFHPRDDRYFLSGSLDGKLRLWNIPDKKVTLWNELDGQTKLITAVNFCRNGRMAVVGSYDGRCIFYHTDQLKYHTQIHVRSSRGKNRQGRKISGIEAMPGEDKILVTSNDSRIRLYDLRDLSLSCKYKGYVNLSSQIKASFSHDGRYIISGSENQFIYIWRTYHDYAKFSRRDRNDYWERIKAHNAVVTSAVFAPKPSLILKQLEQEQEDSGSSSDLSVSNCYVMVSADFCGTIKVFLHKSRATDSS